MRVIYGIYHNLDGMAFRGVLEELYRASETVSMFPALSVRAEVPASQQHAHLQAALARRIQHIAADVIIGHRLSSYWASVDDLLAFREKHPDIRMVDWIDNVPYMIYTLSSAPTLWDILRHIDLVVGDCQAGVQYLTGHGIRAIYVPPFAATSMFGSAQPAPARTTCDVLCPWHTVYSAATHPVAVDRIALARALLDTGVTNIRIYGDIDGFGRLAPDLEPWLRPYVPPATLAGIARRAKVVISTSAVGDMAGSCAPPRGYWPERIPAMQLCGAAVVCDNPVSVQTPWEVDGVTVQYVDGVHLLAAGDVDGMVSAVQRLLSDADLRADIVQAGQTLAREYLTEAVPMRRIVLPAVQALLATG